MVTRSDDTLLVLTSAGPAYVMVTVLSLFLGPGANPSSKPWMTMSTETYGEDWGSPMA